MTINSLSNYKSSESNLTYPSFSTNNLDYKYGNEIKLLIIGDSTVGKTALLEHYETKEFKKSYITTIGIDFKIKKIIYKNIPRKITIWDTAGQERFRTITNAYYRGSHGILLTYDITNRTSFENMNRWMKELQAGTPEGIMIIIIGNKCDMSDERTVSEEEGQAFADKHGSLFFETSAKSGINVDKSFDKLIYGVFDKMEKEVVDHEKNNYFSKRENKSETVVLDQREIKRGCCGSSNTSTVSEK